MKFIDIPEDRQREAINTVALQTGLPPSSIEKDWWVTQVLKALHTLPYAEHIAFKGGTSLSKCWNLIARFSEDVDIALSREFLGFSGDLSKTQISDRLRRAACSFVREKMQHDVRKALVDLGLRADTFSVDVAITPVTTTDPEMITITYHSLYEVSPYIKNTVKIEISGRSMMEPIEKKAINAAIDAHFSKAPFAEKPFEVNRTLPRDFPVRGQRPSNCVNLDLKSILPPTVLNAYMSRQRTSRGSTSAGARQTTKSGRTCI